MNKKVKGEESSRSHWGRVKVVKPRLTMFGRVKGRVKQIAHIFPTHKKILDK